MRLNQKFVPLQHKTMYTCMYTYLQKNHSNEANQIVRSFGYMDEDNGLGETLVMSVSENLGSPQAKMLISCIHTPSVKRHKMDYWKPWQHNKPHPEKGGLWEYLQCHPLWANSLRGWMTEGGKGYPLERDTIPPSSRFRVPRGMVCVTVYDSQEVVRFHIFADHRVPLLMIKW